LELYQFINWMYPLIKVGPFFAMYAWENLRVLHHLRPTTWLQRMKQPRLLPSSQQYAHLYQGMLFVVRLWRKSNEFVGQNYAVARIVMNMLDVQAMLHYQTYQDDENDVLQWHLFPKNASQSTQDSGLPLVLGLISE